MEYFRPKNSTSYPQPLRRLLHKDLHKLSTAFGATNRIDSRKFCALLGPAKALLMGRARRPRATLGSGLMDQEKRDQ